MQRLVHSHVYRALACVPFSTAILVYLTALDVANRHRAAPPFVCASNLQAQFMGLGITTYSRPEQWFLKYLMWSTLIVIETFQDHATVLLTLLHALLGFSFVMDAGVNSYYHGHHFCCSSYAYCVFWASAFVALLVCAIRAKWAVASRWGIVLAWALCGLGILAYDAWRVGHHFLAYFVGTLGAILHSLGTSRSKIRA